jgi:hypothetical protein
VHLQLITHDLDHQGLLCCAACAMPCCAVLCRRIAKATGGRVVLTLADMDGNETFDPAALGTADEVAEIRVADDAMVSHH